MQIFGRVFLAAVLSVGLPFSSFAQDAAPVAAIPNMPGKATSAQLAAFEANPQSFLKDNPIGGLRMTFVVKALTLADPAKVTDSLLTLSKSATTAQAAAIGTGLGQAVKELLAVDKTLADQLAKLIAGSASNDVLAAYNVGSSDIQTLSVGAGVGGAGAVGGGVGGPVDVGGVAPSSSTGTRNPGAGSPGNFFVKNIVATNFTGGFTGASVSLTGGSTTTCTASVSPKKTC